jgi:hypothetical protein
MRLIDFRQSRMSRIVLRVFSDANRLPSCVYFILPDNLIYSAIYVIYIYMYCIFFDLQWTLIIDPLQSCKRLTPKCLCSLPFLIEALIVTEGVAYNMCAQFQ